MILFPNGFLGLADTRWQGASGQVHRSAGINYRNEPGIITVNQKLSKNSGVVVDELCKVSVPVSDGSVLWFSSESGKIWRELAGVYTLLTTLTIPGYTFNLATATDTGKSYNFSVQVNIPFSVAFRPDGLRMYVLCNAKVSGNNGEIFQYALGTAFDVSTASLTSTKIGFDVNGNGMAFSADGTKVYISEDNGGTSVITYTMSTAWDITTAGVAGTSFNFVAQGSRGYQVNFSTDGTKMIVFFGDIPSKVATYTLSTAFNVGTATFTGQLSPAHDWYTGCIAPDGSRLFLQTSSFSGRVYEYILSTPYNVATAVITATNYSTGTGKYFAMAAAPNSSGFYVSTQDTKSVYQYKLIPAPVDLNVKVLGAEEYGVFDGADGPDLDVLNNELKQYIYFATKNWLLRVPVTDLATWNSSYQYLTLFKYSDDTYHPIKKQNNSLFIGDKYTLAQVNEFGVIVLETEFNVLEPERITTLGIIDTDLLVGTKERTRSWVKRWDTEALSWYAQDSVEETEIYAFLPDDNFVYVIAGDFGRMYFYDGEKLQPDARIPGNYGRFGRSKVNQNAVASFFGVPIFGLSNLEGNPSWQGLYSYGRFSKDYAVTMDLSYPLSLGSFSDIEIGSIVVQGHDLLVSWKSGTNVGIDRIDWTAKYESAFIESMVLNGANDRSVFKTIDTINVDYFEMPANTSLEFSVSNNYQGFADIETDQVINSKLNQVQAKATQPELGAVEVMIEFNVSGNLAPKIENVLVKFDGEEIV